MVVPHPVFPHHGRVRGWIDRDDAFERRAMEGGTTFHFVTGGIEEALRLAKQAAGDRDVKIGGGVSTVRQYLEAGLVYSIHFALALVVLGRGEALFPGLDRPALGFSVTEHQAAEYAMYVVLTRSETADPASIDSL